MATGTHDIRDLLNINNQTVESFGEELAYRYLSNYIVAHNARYQSLSGELMTVTTERFLPYGAVGTPDDVIEVGEYGRAPTQKATQSLERIGLPLRKYQFAAGYTRDFIRRQTPAQLAGIALQRASADVRNLYRELRRALFVPTNYTWRDIFVDRLPVDVKRLLNADSQAIPEYDGATFNAATHTHYLGFASWTNAAIDAQIATVREHGHTGQIRVKIAAENYGDMAALTKFTEAPKDLIRYGVGQELAVVPSQDGAADNNRIIGVWDGQYYVETKPWMPANYTYVSDVQGPKPLAMRVEASGPGLTLAAQIDTYPLRADYFERYFGIGVQERTNGCVSLMNNATYGPPAGVQ